MKLEVGEYKIRTVGWDYPPRGPFHVVKQDYGAVGVSYDNHEELHDAIHVFVMTSIPTSNTLVSYLHDANGAVLCGYMVPHLGAEAEWHGCEAGFKALALHHFMDPLECAAAEIAAKRRSEIKL